MWARPRWGALAQALATAAAGALAGAQAALSPRRGAGCGFPGCAPPSPSSDPPRQP